MTLLCGASLFQYNFQKCTGHKGLIAPRKLMFDSTFNLETFLRVPKLKYWPTHSKVHWLFYQFISPKQNKETLCNLCSKIKPGFILTKLQYGNKLPITFLVDFLSSISYFYFFQILMNVLQGNIHVKLELTATIPKVFLLFSSLISKRRSHDSGIFIVDFEHVSHFFLLFSLLILNK